MPKKKLLVKLARLAVKVGINVQPGQVVLIKAPASEYQLVRILTKEAYRAKARKVIVDFYDEVCQRHDYLHQRLSSLKEFPSFAAAKLQYLIDHDVATIHVISEIPGIMRSVNPLRVQRTRQAHLSQPVVKAYRELSMKNTTQWTIIASPCAEWAKKVFPDLSRTKSLQALWSAILKVSRVDDATDPVENWHAHIAALKHRNDILTQFAFDHLHFTSASSGTDLRVGLVANHCWEGGAEFDAQGRIFAANIPTEENFTMPHRLRVDGVVNATYPLNYDGKLIEGMKLEFKNGIVINFDADKNVDTLRTLIEFDAGSARLGEVALVPVDSPIAQSKILFYNTLFDENASCHLALGASYATNLKGGAALNAEERLALGANDSQVHVDFMFGTPDMRVVGYRADGTSVVIMENGKFVI